MLLCALCLSVWRRRRTPRSVVHRGSCSVSSLGRRFNLISHHDVAVTSRVVDVRQLTSPCSRWRHCAEVWYDSFITVWCSAYCRLCCLSVCLSVLDYHLLETLRAGCSQSSLTTQLYVALLNITDPILNMELHLSWFLCLMESPGVFFSWKFQDLESAGKSLWTWKVVEKYPWKSCIFLVVQIENKHQ